MARSVPGAWAAAVLACAGVACGGGGGGGDPGTPPGAPAAPTGLTATAAGDSAIHLTWTDASSDETGFRLERRTGGGAWTEIETLPAGATSHDDVDLAARTTYSYRIRATNGAGDSAYSDAASATTLAPAPTPPEPPTDLVVASSALLEVHLTWTDHASTESRFELERSPDGATWTALGAVGANATDYDDAVPLTATAYTYRVRAANSAGASAYATSGAFRRPNVMFLTSATWTAGGLGGLAGADAKCQALADAAHLGGTYRAWLSTSGSGGVTAPERLGTARGWIRADGKPFADRVSDLAYTCGDHHCARLFYPPRVDEWGRDVTAYRAAWTATRGNGTRFGNTCGNWADTSCTDDVASGISRLGGEGWTYTVLNDAQAPHNLYCFGVDNAVAVAPVPVAGRRAFATRGGFVPGTGRSIADADALCAQEASAAGLTTITGFRAALATTTAAAGSRFSPDGLPWVRTDGVRLSSTAAAMLEPSFLDAAPNRYADGTVSGQEVSIGSQTWGAPGTVSSTCNDYASASGTPYWNDLEDTLHDAITVGASNGCKNGFALLCLEQ